MIDQRFQGLTYSLKSLFRDERQRIVKQIVSSSLADMNRVYAEAYKQHGPLISFLSELHMPIPTILRASADFVLGNAIESCLASEKLDLDRIRRLLEDVNENIDSGLDCSLEPVLRHRLDIALDAWENDPFSLGRLQEVTTVIVLSQIPSFRADLWRAQNVYYDVQQRILSGTCELNARGRDRFRKLGEQLGVASTQSMPAREHVLPEIGIEYRIPGILQDVPDHNSIALPGL